MDPFLPLALRPRGATASATRVLVALTLAILFQFVPAQLQSGSAQTPSRGSLPFDPLTPEERALAMRAVEGDANARKLRGVGRQRLISVELVTAKTTQSDAGIRNAEVLYYRYRGNQGILSLVDLSQGIVRETVPISGDAVPLVAEEVNEALALALQNKTLTNLLGPDYQRYQVATQDLRAGQANQVEALRLLASKPKDPCYQHRCLSLLFRQGETFLTGTSVIVDLTTQVARVEQLGSARGVVRRRRR